MMKHNRKWLLIALFWLLLWQIAAMAVSSKLLLPSPVDTVVALAGLLCDGGFYIDALMTICRCIVAIVLAIVCGFGLALAAYKNKLVRDILSLPVSFLKAVPVMAIAIYMILLMSAGNVPILVCWAMCFPIAYTNLLTGLDSIDSGLIEMANMYKITGSKRTKLIDAPAIIPYFSSAMSLIAGMSWKAIVTAEVLSIPQFSLGYELMNAKYYLNTDVLFAYVLVIIAISVIFENGVKKLLAKLTAREYEYSKVEKMRIRSIAKYNEHNAARVELQHICKSFDEKVVLNDFSMTLEPNSVTALMGASGSGKTTIARIISGLETADSGNVSVDTDRIAYLFQEDRLIPWLNIYDNLAIIRPDSESGLISSLLNAVGLNEVAWKLPSELSGGMNYRAAMARAFLYDAPLLIADEPFRGLDENTRNEVVEKLWKPGVVGKTVLMITHSNEDAVLAEKTVRI